MERKIGEIFIYKGKTYQVVESIRCDGCAFNKSVKCSTIREPLGSCDPIKRKDSINVVFKEIKDMEIKNNQLTIDIPEGMEIDLEKSNLAKGIVKFKKKDITYSDVLQVTDSVELRISTHCLDKILAISQLMNIAKYYNGNWNYKVNGSERGYMIAYDKTRIIDDGYQVVHINSDTDMYFGNIMFKNEADAQCVIDNPNFRDILNAIYKN